MSTRHRLLAALLPLGLLPAADWHADPATGKTGNAGSATAPWPSLAETVAAGLLQRLQDGDRLLLASGDHGEVAITGDHAEPVTIAAAPGADPHLARLRVDGRNWRIRGLRISASFARQPYAGSMVSLGGRSPSRALVIEDCFVFSAPDHHAWTAADWMRANNGIELGRHGSALVARNNFVLNTRFGINVCAPDSLVEGNVVSDFSGDALRLTRDGARARRNVLKNCHVGAKDGDDNHDDAIQCFLFNKGTGTIRGFVITENLIIDREDPRQPFPHSMQGIGAFDGPLVGFTVSGNVVRSATWHGVSLYDAQGCTVEGNACSTGSATGPRPWVMFGTKLKQVGPGNVARGNLACDFKFKDAPGAFLEGNHSATAAGFQARFDGLRSAIDAEFGPIHPVAGLPRVAGQVAEVPAAR